MAEAVCTQSISCYGTRAAQEEAWYPISLEKEPQMPVGGIWVGLIWFGTSRLPALDTSEDPVDKPKLCIFCRDKQANLRHVRHQRNLLQEH